MNAKWIFGAVALLLAGCAASTRPDAPVAAAPSAATPVPPPAATAQTLPPALSPALTPQQQTERAMAAVAQKDLGTAKQLLRQLVERMPADWRPVQLGENDVAIAYWDVAEFIACSGRDGERLHKSNVVALAEPYVVAWYLIAFVALEENDLATAERSIDRALQLEPQRALLLNERATILQQQHRLEEAVQSNRRAIDSPQCADPAVHKSDLSRAWRSMGSSFVDLGKYDEADAAFSESLKIDPGNRATFNEIVYLERKRGKKPPSSATAIQRMPPAGQQ